MFFLRKQILTELHLGYFGIVRIKYLARRYKWWNNIDKDIKYISKNCSNCNTYKNNSPKVTNHIWESTNIPFEELQGHF